MRFCVAAGCVLSALSLLGQTATSAGAQNTSAPGMHWVATWGASAQKPGPTYMRAPASPPSAGTTPPAGGPPAAGAQGSGASAPGGRPPFVQRPPRSFNNQTVRMVVRASMGGSMVRVRLSNAFGTLPVTLGAVHIAQRSTGSGIAAGTDHSLLFNGKPSITIPAGADMWSDPIAFTVPAMGDLMVSVYVPGDSGPATVHSLGLHTTWISKEGDQTAAPDMTDAETVMSWFFVSGVDVQAPADAATIVAFGDSITDGATSTPNTDASWPGVLARRLAANPSTAHVAIVNEGISGNQILRDGAGVSALARFDRDVLAVPGVKWLMILEGINDMNGAQRAPATPGVPVVTADDLIGAMKQMIVRAHDHGIQVIGCTLTPFGNASPAVETMRQTMNAFIRAAGNFDAVVDFDKIEQDPANPMQFHAGYNNTDKLHPNDAGYKAMADGVDLGLFASKAVRGKR